MKFFRNSSFIMFILIVFGILGVTFIIQFGDELDDRPALTKSAWVEFEVLTELEGEPPPEVEILSKSIQCVLPGDCEAGTMTGSSRSGSQGTEWYLTQARVKHASDLVLRARGYGTHRAVFRVFDHEPGETSRPLAAYAFDFSLNGNGNQFVPVAKYTSFASGGDPREVTLEPNWDLKPVLIVVTTRR